ncbi:MAG: hypothetical protein ABFR62_01630 [Bacteroidota bacterium]
MKNLMHRTILLGTLTLVLLSCEKQSEDTLQEVSFSINNETNNLNKKNDIVYPECSNEAPAYVIATIDDEDYRLEVLQNLDEGTQTQTVKFKTGKYTLQSFKVFDADHVLIWAAPEKESDYAKLWDIEGLEKTFEVSEFKKIKIPVDVLCFTPSYWKEFGFAWFDFNMIKVKTICFSGDFFTKFCRNFTPYLYSYPGSPYEGQSHEGDSFKAIFKVLIKNENGVVLNNQKNNSNLKRAGIDRPLCIEFPDYLNKEDRYTFEIYLALHDNTWPLVHTSEVFLAEDDISNITGENGIFNFGFGNCPQGIELKMDLPFCPEIEIGTPETIIKTLCFFGDICTPNYSDWGESQSDFVADMRVTILDHSADAHKEKEISIAYSSDFANNQPLCIEYPDYTDKKDEKYWVNIHIKDLNGDWILVEGRKLNPNLSPSAFYGKDTNGEIDTDGIFDFVVYEGENCNYINNEGVNLIKEIEFDSPD